MQQFSESVFTKTFIHSIFFTFCGPVNQNWAQIYNIILNQI